MHVYITTKPFLRACLICYFSYSNSFYQQNIGCFESYSTMFASSNRLWTQFRVVTMNQLYFPGWSLSRFKNETSRLLTYNIFWWKKITSSKSSKRTAWCKGGSRTPGPTTLGSGTRDHPQCLKVGPRTTSKFKSVTPSSFFNEFIFFRTFHVLFLLI